MNDPEYAIQRLQLIKLKKNRLILLDQLDELDFTLHDDDHKPPPDDYDTTDASSSHDEISLSTQNTDPNFQPDCFKSQGLIRHSLTPMKVHHDLDCQIENALMTLSILNEIIDIDMAVIENQLVSLVEDMQLCKAYNTHVVEKPFEKVFTLRCYKVLERS